MIAKQPRRTLVFDDKDEASVKKIAADIGCHYSKANDRTYNLNKYDAVDQSEKCVFAWVHKEEKNYLWVSTRSVWVEEARARLLAGRNKSGLSSFPRQDQHPEDSMAFDMTVDYDKTVRVLTLINAAR